LSVSRDTRVDVESHESLPDWQKIRIVGFHFAIQAGPLTTKCPFDLQHFKMEANSTIYFTGETIFCANLGVISAAEIDFERLVKRTLNSDKKAEDFPPSLKNAQTPAQAKMLDANFPNKAIFSEHL
jgi:hypothetical protein